MDNWDDLRFLVALSRTGTMKSAAQLLGTNTATVSRRIERLSETLGESAFVKTRDGWKPSEAAQSLIQIAQSFDGQLRTAMNAGTNEGSEPVTIKLGSVPFVVRNLLIPGLSRYEEALDGINLVLTDRVNRDGLGEHDLVIQMDPPSHGRVVTRKVGTLPSRLYKPKGLKNTTDWAGFMESMDALPLQQFGFEAFGKPPRIRVGSADALRSLMKSTGLVAPLPDIVASMDDELEPYAPDAAPYVGEFWMFYHESRRHDRVVRAIVDFVVQCFDDASHASDRVKAAE